MTASGAARSSPGASGMSIGVVLAQLKSEFTDLSISKIRFLETEKLVTPSRTSSGYRQFFAPDVERLRYILTAQRDYYLPLKVIKQQLDAIDRGLEPSSPGPRPPRSLVVAADIDSTDLPSGGDAAMTRDELLAEADLAEQQLDEAESFGLVEPGPTGRYGADAVLAARTVGELLELGLEPRHLRSLRTTADREAAMVTQLVTAQSRQRDPDARQRARSDAADHAATLLRLHALLVKTSLARELGF